MENKQGIKAALSFGAKSVDTDTLEQLLTTERSQAADFFFNTVESIVKDGNSQFWVIIANRGMGKTHLLRVLHSRISKFSNEDKLKIAYFAEEEYGIDSFFDFLLRILNSFLKWYDDDNEYLNSELEKLQNIPNNSQLAYLESLIKKYAAKRPLLIIAENFADVLNQMGNQEQGRLRAWLYDNTNVSIIASSQAISDNFDKEDRPFYGFFTPYYLKKLSYEESLNFLISLATLDKDEKLIEHLNYKGKAQVRAIHDLVKGNHRLLVTFYQFLKTDRLAKVSDTFIKTINDLKPYYETYIRYLPPQQQKIIRYIALSRKPQKGVDISKNCFIEQKTVSKQLSELSRKNLIDIIPDPSDKRNKFYDISEPLLRISIEVGEHKEGITALFIDFLSSYYSVFELIRKKVDLQKLNSNTEYDANIYYELEAINKALNEKDQNEKVTYAESLIHQFLDEFNKPKYNNFRYFQTNDWLKAINEIINLNFKFTNIINFRLKNYLEHFKEIFKSLSIEEKRKIYIRSANKGLLMILHLLQEEVNDSLKQDESLVNILTYWIIKSFQGPGILQETEVSFIKDYLLKNKSQFEFYEQVEVILKVYSEAIIQGKHKSAFLNLPKEQYLFFKEKIFINHNL